MEAFEVNFLIFKRSNESWEEAFERFKHLRSGLRIVKSIF